MVYVICSTTPIEFDLTSSSWRRRAEGYAALNAVIHRHTWEKSVAVSLHIGRLCAQVAEKQLRGYRHFVVEQPCGSALFEIEEWKWISQFLWLVWFDHTGMPIKKRTELRASAPELIQRFASAQCDQSHEHARLGGERGNPHREPTIDAQGWPVRLCSTLASDCALLLARHRSQQRQVLYPNHGNDHQN